MLKQTSPRLEACSFNEFIVPRLEVLRDDLIKECEKIAGHRELPLKLEIERVQKLNKVLHRKLSVIPRDQVMTSLQSIERKAAESGISLISGVDARSPREIEDVDKNVDCRSQVASKSFHATRTDGETNGFNGTQLLEAAGEDHSGFERECDTSGRDLLQEDSPIMRVITDEDELFSGINDSDFNLWPEWEKFSDKSLYRSSPSKTSEEVAPGSDTCTKGYSFLTLKHDQRSWCTVYPNSCLALTFDFIGIPMLLYDLITLPLQVFWQHHGETAAVFSWCVIIYWTVDIFLRLFVIGYVTQSGKVKLKRRDIMKRYMKRSMLFDLVMVIPDWISVLGDIPRRLAFFRIFRAMRFMRVLRVSKLRNTSRVLQDAVDSEYFSIYMNVTWNSLLILGCCHYVACLWYWVGKQGDSQGNDVWMHKYMPEDGYDWQNAYLTSLHWALCQFTPGSINVQPNWTNNMERVFAILTLIWGMVFFSLFLSSITQERMRMRALSKKIERDNWLLRRYMRQHGVSREFSMRAVQYVDAFVAPMLSRVQRKDVAMLDCLSRPLQVELQTEIYFHTLHANPFCANLKEKGAHMAAILFSHVVMESALAKHDLLFDNGQVSHQMFFVSTGAVAYVKTQRRAITSLEPTDWCCEQVLFVPWVHKGTARAAGESHLLCVDSGKFRSAVLEYRERSYVCNCAKAYLQDLKKFASSGVEVDDLIRLYSYDYEFMEAVNADIDESMALRTCSMRGTV